MNLESTSSFLVTHVLLSRFNHFTLADILTILHFALGPMCGALSSSTWTIAVARGTVSARGSQRHNATAFLIWAL